jgi:hypothetical protein
MRLRGLPGHFTLPGPQIHGDTMSRLLLACAILLVANVSHAQTAKPKSPGEIAATDRAAMEKKADCTRQAKEQKLGLLARRKFVKVCVNG